MWIQKLAGGFWGNYTCSHKHKHDDNIKGAEDGRCVGVGTMKPRKQLQLVILPWRRKRKKTLQMSNVMVIPQFVRNLIGVGRLT